MKKAIPFLAALFYIVSPLPSFGGEKIDFSISPQRSATELAELWIPLFKELERASDLEISFSTTPDAPSFFKRLTQGQTDVSFIDPYAFSALPKGLYKAIAKPLNVQGITQDNYGVVVVAQNSPYQSLDDLNNKKISFPNPEAFSASVLPRFHMQATGLSYQASFSRSDISSALLVIMGMSDAAGIDVVIYNSLPTDLKNKLRPIWTSTPSDLCQGMKNLPFVFALKETLPEKTQQKITKALLSAAKTSTGQRLLNKLGFQNIIAATSQEWQGITSLSTVIFTE